METNQNETKTREFPLDSVLVAVREQGRIWASYGLTVGKLALETHARAMSSLATSLGAVVESIAAKPGAPGAADPHDPQA